MPQITNKLYKCTQCGHEEMHATNHYGPTWSVGTYHACPKCPPYKKYSEFGGQTTWECQEKEPKTEDLISTPKKIVMEKIHIVYTCDANHMHASKIPIAYCRRRTLANACVTDHSLISEEGHLTVHDYYLLDTINQTQNRSENYIIEEVPLNTLL